MVEGSKSPTTPTNGRSSRLKRPARGSRSGFEWVSKGFRKGFGVGAQARETLRAAGAGVGSVWNISSSGTLLLFVLFGAAFCVCFVCVCVCFACVLVAVGWNLFLAAPSVTFSVALLWENHGRGAFFILFCVFFFIFFLQFVPHIAFS